MSIEPANQPGTIIQAVSPTDTLIVSADFSHCPPTSLCTYWTTPELLRCWWPPEATIEPRVGGAYHLAWPQMNWHLRGHYTTFAPGQALSFTWRWDHDPPELPPRQVALIFDPLPEGGTQLTVTHGPYTDSEADQEERRGHLEGWTNFLGKLHMASQQGGGGGGSRV